MELFKTAGAILEKLDSLGFEAYFAGGCVRDFIMQRPIHDFDITTSALPAQVIEVFGKENTVPTGIAHGTVTVRCAGTSAEVTTYRIDGEYSDNRRPDSVTFTASLTEDLARRDFTMNALAMDLNGTVIDPFGGREDIARGMIRCVGDPAKRFTEDALRIMRALRFASQLGFTIDPATDIAVHTMKNRLSLISAERVREELDKLICGEYCVPVLLAHNDIITEIIPEFKSSVGFDQHTPYHKYTVWEHIVRAASAASADDLTLRRALFFHDIGKPACARFDESGRGHFKGHDKVGADMAREIMHRLKYSNPAINSAVTLIANHSAKLRTKADVLRMMYTVGDELFFKLMEMKKCDNSAKAESVLEENIFFDELIALGSEIVSNNECRSLKQLKIDGNDLSTLGLSGAQIGQALHELLGDVFDEELPNERAALLNAAEKRWAR